MQRYPQQPSSTDSAARTAASVTSYGLSVSEMFRVSRPAATQACTSASAIRTQLGWAKCG